MDVFGTADTNGTHDWRLTSLGDQDDPAFLDRLAGIVSVSFSGPAGRTPTFTLRQAVAGPLSAAPDLSRVVQMYVYQPFSVPVILDFDRRITERYSTFWAQHGEFYAGTFSCREFGPQWVVEVATFAADDPDAAEALVQGVQPPPDVQAIIAECKALQNRQLPRYLVWMTPKESSR
jgi:hypothetical protein